jgi:DNA repair exonuclease SbcCD ATPase subunit
MSMIDHLFHPLRKSYEEDELKMLLEVAEERCLHLEKENARLEKENNSQIEEIQALKKDLNESASRISSLETEIADAQEEAEHIQEIENAISKFEELQAHYRTTIKNLKEKLAESRENLKTLNPERDFSTISMDQTNIKVIQPELPLMAPANNAAYSNELDEPDNEDSDWLEKLPPTLNSSL